MGVGEKCSRHRVTATSKERYNRNIMRMKRLVIFLLLTLLAMPTAEAKRRETAEEIERKTRKYEGWEQSASARFALIFYDAKYMHITGQPAQRTYRSKVHIGGSFTYGGGYLINNHWRVGAELGIQPQFNCTVMPIYATAHYFYGKRKNCLFNFVNVGTNILFDKGMRFGGIYAGGIGFRFQGVDSYNKIDLMLGYQLLQTSPRPTIKEPYAFDAKDVKLRGTNQSVFIGLSYSF